MTGTRIQTLQQGTCDVQTGEMMQRLVPREHKADQPLKMDPRLGEEFAAKIDAVLQEKRARERRWSRYESGSGGQE